MILKKNLLKLYIINSIKKCIFTKINYNIGQIYRLNIKLLFILYYTSTYKYKY